MESIKLVAGSNGTFEVEAHNGVKIGDFLCKEDGFYDFWPILRGGYWPAYMLHAIAEKLDELNAPYEEELRKYFEPTDI